MDETQHIRRLIAQDAIDCEVCDAQIAAHSSYFLILDAHACCVCAKSLMQEAVATFAVEWPIELEVEQ